MSNHVIQTVERIPEDPNDPMLVKVLREISVKDANLVLARNGKSSIEQSVVSNNVSHFHCM